MYVFLQGMIWISLVTIAEVPPAVRPLKFQKPLLSVYLFVLDLPSVELE